jgi:beta-galactosidase
MSYSSVWLNGRLVGGWPYGYASYQVDLTPYLKVGEDNLLAIRLDNPADSSRWYPGGGIYRNVWLLKTAPLHVAHWGTAVTTPKVSPDDATVALKVSLQNDGPVAAEVKVQTEVYELGRSGSRSGGAIASSDAVMAQVEPGGKISECVQTLHVGHPMLWSPRSPYRYVAVTTVQGGAHSPNAPSTLDVYETPFGIRTLEFNPDRGFILNGSVLRFNGVCDHADLGALGSAVNVRGLERQLEILQEMGCNAIRTSHNPPAPELLELCDRMGFVVMDEAFDCWGQQKRPKDYHLLFNDWHAADLRAMIRRDRNHPSIVMWSIGNEIPEQKKPAVGIALGRELQSIVHQEDPTRPVTSACNEASSDDNGFAGIVDVFGYNYHWAKYAEFRKKYPAKFLFGSETESTVSSRGVYVFPVSNDKSKGLTTPDYQVSSYDLSAPRWAFPPDDEFRTEDSVAGVGGEFVWTGFDYLGEPTPYGKAGDPARSSYFGILDLAGFKKDRFYIYQAHWRPDFPLAHLLPHWTWPDRVGQVTPVHVYTSGDEAELFLNGRSLGRKRKAVGEYRLRWDDVVYQPGVLKVVAYKNGAPWAEDEKHTAGEPAELHAAADHQVVRADGSDLSYITISITDAQGNPCPHANGEVRFALTGPGDIVGVDNGDATSFEPFQATRHKAFNGMALVIVRSRRNGPGVIHLVARSPGLKAAAVDIRSDAPDL